MNPMTESHRRLIEALDCATCRLFYTIIEEKDARIKELEAQLDRHHENLIISDLDKEARSKRAQ